MISEKIILGTAQLGLQYGINNSLGKPNLKTAFEILEIAKANGISTTDTAEAYGNAIEIIGEFSSKSSSRFNIISKFEFKAGQNIKSNLQRANKTLHTERLYAYLLHNPVYLFENEVIDNLLELKQSGIIENAGVSIYTNEQFLKAISADHIDLIQIPYNLFDNDNIRGSLIKQAKEKGKLIHIRSVFLQGLFFMTENNLPLKLGVFKKYLSEIREICNRFCVSISKVALHYALANEAIDGVLVGVESSDQLLQNISDASTPIPKEIISLIDRIVVKETELLNPANWN